MFGGISDNDKRTFILGGILIGVTMGMYLFCKYVLVLVAPFLIGLLIATAIKKPVFFMKRKFGINPIVGAILVICGCVFIAGFFLIYVGSRFFSELKKFMLNYDYYSNRLSDSVCQICYKVDEMMDFTKGVTYTMVEENVGRTIEGVSDNMLPVIVEKSMTLVTGTFILGGAVIIVLTAVIFLIRDMEKLSEWINNGPYAKWFNIFLRRLVHFGITYVRTQLVIMGITAVVCTMVMFIINNGYPVMIGVLIGIMDALPLFGTGIVLIPWTFFMIFSGNYLKAAVIFTGYCICYIVREFLEPKMMGGQMGIEPLIMLIMMYVGVLLFGVAGFVLGPAVYIVICEVMKYISRII